MKGWIKIIDREGIVYWLHVAHISCIEETRTESFTCGAQCYRPEGGACRIRMTDGTAIDVEESASAIAEGLTRLEEQ